MSIISIVEFESVMMSTEIPTPEDLQRKLYFLLEQLQEMARELPP